MIKGLHARNGLTLVSYLPFHIEEIVTNMVQFTSKWVRMIYEKSQVEVPTMPFVHKGKM